MDVDQKKTEELQDTDKAQKKVEELTPEEYEKIVKPHFDSLFTGKYDLIINPEKDSPDSPVNLSLILRVVIKSLSTVANDLKARQSQ